MKLVVREGVFIPIKKITDTTKKIITKKLTYHFYKKEGQPCMECSNLPERPNDLCERCPVYDGCYKLFKNVVVGNNKYIQVPVGSLASVKKIIEKIDESETIIVDKQPENLFIKKINFTGKLLPQQQEAILPLIEKKRGELKAPPRSGKTVLSTALICKLRRKTLILANQRDWLVGFMETFVGSKTQKALTDIDKDRIGFCKDLDDFKKYDVCLATVQTFYSEKGQSILEKIRDFFEVVIIDEVHTAAAAKYLKIIGKINSRYMIGLSGTPYRKDTKHIMTEQLIGPVIHTIELKTMQPTVKVVSTNYKKNFRGNTPWHLLTGSIEKDEQRIKIIAKEVIKDVKDGHMVLIPLSGLKAIQKTIECINKIAGERLAYPFTGSLRKKDRDLTIENARRYKVKVIVGTSKILSTGINIPRASCIYEVSLSSNEANAEQRMRRVLTYTKDKPAPVIKFFLDDSNVRRNCMRNEWFNVVIKKIKPVVEQHEKDLMKAYFSSKKRQYEAPY